MRLPQRSLVDGPVGFECRMRRWFCAHHVKSPKFRPTAFVDESLKVVAIVFADIVSKKLTLTTNNTHQNHNF